MEAAKECAGIRDLLAGALEDTAEVCYLTEKICGGAADPYGNLRGSVGLCNDTGNRDKGEIADYWDFDEDRHDRDKK